MSQPTDVREAAADALDQVVGLRAHATPPGSVVPPAALIDFGRIGPFPASFDNATTYLIRVTLLVQLGDFRSSQTRLEELLDPVGTVSTSAVVALQSDSRFGQITVEDFGQVDYAGTQYAGALLTVDAYF